ncbi:MAG: hypothetical protein R6W78_01635 [Bacteroidales bacterium]
MRYILISDGSSDKALLPIIDFLLKSIVPDEDIIGERADLARLPKPPKRLEEKILTALELYEPDYIFIHRDAEKMLLSERDNEIEIAIQKVRAKTAATNPFFKLIPIKMTEAWLLIDEKAIKHASGNPNSRIRLDMPSIKNLEKISNPKRILEQLIKSASGLSGRRLQSLNLRMHIQLVSMYIDDFSVLEGLVAYKHFKTQVIRCFNS